MAGLYRPDEPFEIYSAHSRAYEIVLRAETNSGGSPDGAEPDANVTWASTATAGKFTAVLSTGAPVEVLAGFGYVEEAVSAVPGTTYGITYTGYTASTGTVAIDFWSVVSGTNSTPALTTADGQTIVLILKCRRT